MVTRTSLRDALLWVLAANRDPDWWQPLMDPAFLEFIDERRRAWWNNLPARERARWLLGQLWNCPDTLPEEYCARLGLPAGSTYSQAVQRLRERLPS